MQMQILMKKCKYFRYRTCQHPKWNEVILSPYSLFVLFASSKRPNFIQISTFHKKAKTTKLR